MTATPRQARSETRPPDAANVVHAMAECLEARPARLAVACSGGPDSMALALLLRDWAAARDVPFHAYIVDHGLRAEAASEAATVRTRLAGQGIAATVLTAPADALSPTGGDVQARARDLRYRLLLARCRADGVTTLAFAHHLEDQAETVLLRLARGSGVDGLAAMAPVREWAGVRLIRPLLAFPKAALVAHLRAQGVAWVEDPSNRDARFARVAVRQRAEALSAIGLTPERLAKTARRMARARAALDRATDDLLVAAGREDPAGFVSLQRAALLAAPEEVGLRALARTVCRVGGRVHPPRLDRLEGAYEALAADRLGGGRTLAGTALRPLADGRLLICREAAQVREETPLAAEMLWDGRFALGFDDPSSDYSVRALGSDGWRFLRRADAAAGRRGAELPGPVRVTLPALWRGTELVHAPHLQPDGGLVPGPRPTALCFAGPWL